MSKLTLSTIDKFRKEVAKESNVKTLQAAASSSALVDITFVPTNAAKLNGAFEVEVDVNGITAQRMSGRCWLFAALNILREKAAKNLNVKEFEISENYLSFYDKLEKSNTMLSMAIDNAELDEDARMTEYIREGFGDGGYFDEAADLVEKYGIVPKSVFPETYQSENTAQMNDKLLRILKMDVSRLRDLANKKGKKEAEKEKEKMLLDIYRMLVICFGEPPKTFTYAWKEKEGKNGKQKFNEVRDITPIEFRDKYAGGNVLKDYITITNHPTKALPMNLYYKFHYIGCMADKDILNLNLEIEDLENLCVKMLKGGTPVWFGCDSGAFGSRKNGIWDQDSFDFSGILGGVSFEEEKGDLIVAHAGLADHAMILTGVAFDENGKPARWKIENSWGKDAGKDGFFVCSEKYFEKYVFEAVIDKKYLTKEQKALLKKKPVEIPAWSADWV